VGALGAPHAGAATVEERLKALEAQNDALLRQLAEQKKEIDELKGNSEGSGAADNEQRSAPEKGFGFGKMHLSAEGGIGFFSSNGQGQYPNSSFRVDEAKLFLEAPVWEDTYFFSELDLVTREANDEFFHLGELYIDFENVLRHWTDKNWLSLRVGRVDIPFGEEYAARDVVDNPLITHSLTDFWGVDEGVEFYGGAFGFDYVMAVQNGGHPTLSDANADKAIAGRVGYNFGDRARLSFSGMRTGQLSSAGDRMSELWFGGGFLRNLGRVETTSSYQADVFELDAQTFWKSGHLKMAGGYFDYDDTDALAEHQRDGYYYYAEALQRLPGRFYTAGRFSQIIADRGMPIVGLGDFGDYFFGPLTRDLWRLSIGLGYQWSDNFVSKVEYTVEEGSLANGGDKLHRSFVGAELGFKF
jgi:hypothetical protein